MTLRLPPGVTPALMTNSADSRFLKSKLDGGARSQMFNNPPPGYGRAGFGSFGPTDPDLGVTSSTRLDSQAATNVYMYPTNVGQAESLQLSPGTGVFLVADSASALNPRKQKIMSQAQLNVQLFHDAKRIDPMFYDPPDEPMNKLRRGGGARICTLKFPVFDWNTYQIIAGRYIKFLGFVVTNMSEFVARDGRYYISVCTSGLQTVPNLFGRCIPDDTIGYILRPALKHQMGVTVVCLQIMPFAKRGNHGAPIDFYRAEENKRPKSEGGTYGKYYNNSVTGAHPTEALAMRVAFAAQDPGTRRLTEPVTWRSVVGVFYHVGKVHYKTGSPSIDKINSIISNPKLHTLGTGSNVQLLIGI